MPDKVEVGISDTPTMRVFLDRAKAEYLGALLTEHDGSTVAVADALGCSKANINKMLGLLHKKYA